MIPARFKAVLFPKPYADGYHPIYIRIYQKRKSNYISVGRSIPKGAWNTERSELWESKTNLTWELLEKMTKEEHRIFREKQAAIVILPDARKINSQIRLKLKTLESLQNKLTGNQKIIDPKILKNKALKIDPPDKGRWDLLKYIEEIARKKYRIRQIRTSEKYSVLLTKLKAFRKDKAIPPEELTIDFLNDFQSFLKENGYHQNYIYNLLKSLKTIIQKEAIKGNKILTPESNPFIWFSMPKILPSVMEKLDINEIQKIEDLDLDRKQPVFHVRNAFIFSFYLAGISIGDLLQLRWMNITDYGRLNYFQGRTGKERSVKLLPQALKILGIYEADKKNETDYIFPFLEKNEPYSKLLNPEDFQKASPEIINRLIRKLESRITQYNRELKKIAGKAEINKNLTSRIARHSFAGIASARVSVYDIHKMIGHSGFRITEVYLKNLDNDAIDGSMEKVFS